MSEQSLDSLFEEATAMQEQIEALKEKMNNDIFAKLKEIIPVKFKDINFKCILAIGSTPSFNDGDDCVHEFNLYYGERATRTSWNGSDVTFFDFHDYDDFDLFADLFEEEGINPNEIESENTDIIPFTSDEEGEIIKSFFNKFNTLCENLDITDFQIGVFKKKDGEIVVEIDEEYDCGY